MELKQKFHKGDLVKVAKDQGPSRSHFPGNCYAIVVGSYHDVCIVHDSVSHPNLTNVR